MVPQTGAERSCRALELAHNLGSVGHPAALEFLGGFVDAALPCRAAADFTPPFAGIFGLAGVAHALAEDGFFLFAYAADGLRPFLGVHAEIVPCFP